MGEAAHVWEDIVVANRDYVYNLAYYLSRDRHAAGKSHSARWDWR